MFRVREITHFPRFLQLGALQGKAIFMALFCLAFTQLAFGATPQTITFPAIGNTSATAPAFHLGATASSGLPVSYAVVGGTAQAGVAGDLLTLTGITGPVTIKATQVGDQTYDAAPEVIRTFSVVVAAAALPWKSLSGGYMAVRSDGTLWGWGNNYKGQIGDGTTVARSVPVQIGIETDWATVTTANSTTAAIKTDGSLWTCGDNFYGQLGYTGGDRSTFARVGTATNWKQVAIGFGEVAAVKTDGTLWDWGNYNATPTQVGTLTTWTSISGGYANFAAIRSDGTLWIWGSGEYGQLGGQSSKYNPNQMVNVGVGQTWKAVTVGNYYIVALCTDGSLWSWGINNQNQLGLGSSGNRNTPTRVGEDYDWKEVSSGGVNTLARKTNGTLWGWGDNQIGEVGDGTQSHHSTPIRIGQDSDWSLVSFNGAALCCKADGSLWSWNLFYPANTISYDSNFRPMAESLGDVDSFSAGGCSAALKRDGTIWTWGDNSYGELGDGTTTSRNQPAEVGVLNTWKAVFAGSSVTFGIQTDGTLWSWGSSYGNLLGFASYSSVLVPPPVGAGGSWKAIFPGDYHCMALKTDGTLWAWGKNDFGQLGLGGGTLGPQVITPQQVGSVTNWKTASVGNNFTAAIKTDGTLWTWGSNIGGQLGLGDSTDRSSPTQVGTDTKWASVSSINDYTIAVKTNGTLWLIASYSSSYGVPSQIGTATDWKAATAYDAARAILLKTNGTLWLLDDNFNLTQISPAAKWTRIPSQGTYNTMMATTADGLLWGFGNNFYGQLASAGINFLIPQRIFPLLSAQTLTFPAFTLSMGNPATLQAVASSGLPVAYHISGPATLTGNQLVATGAGEVNVVAYQVGDSIWDSTGPVSRSVTVGPDTRTAQTITFPAISGQVAGVSPVTLSATASSGLPVTYTLVSGPGEISGGQLAILGVGTISVRASQAGNGSYLPASPVTVSVTVSKASQTIDFPAVSGPSFNGAPVMLAATASSGLPVTFDLVSGPASLNGSELTFLGAGTVTVRASQAGNASYLAATPVSLDIAVGKSSQTITFPAISGQTFNGPPATLAATASSGLAVVYSLVSGPATLNGDQLTFTGAGTVTVRASQTGDANYLAAMPVSIDIVVGKSAQTITFPAVSSQSFGGAPVTLTATASSGLPVAYAILSGPGSLNGSELTFTGAGTVIVQATQPGGADYLAASASSITIIVGKASQTITFPAIPAQSYGSPAITLHATATSGLPVTYAASGPASLTGGSLSFTGVGTVAVTATQAGNDLYSAATSVKVTFNVTKASQTITFPAMVSHPWGPTPVILNATASSGLPIVYSAVGPATVSGNSLTLTGVGKITVTARQGGDALHNYAPAVSVSFTATKASQTITFPPQTSHAFGGPAVILNATASSGLPITYTVEGPATVSGNSLTLTGVGRIKVTARQGGDTSYNYAAGVYVIFTATKGSQTITFPAIPTQTLGGPAVTLGATASSGLPITYTVEGPATISGNTLTPTGAGKVTVTARQGGSTSYNYAAAVKVSFIVAKAK